MERSSSIKQGIDQPIPLNKTKVNDTLDGREQELRADSQRECFQGSGHKPRRPLSLYPAAILGTAMVARGEIGFLIASLSESNRTFAAVPSEGAAGADNSDTFMIVIWAIVLCTVIGPIGVGILVRRVRKLQADGRTRSAGPEPLGDWGVISPYNLQRNQSD